MFTRVSRTEGFVPLKPAARRVEIMVGRRRERWRSWVCEDMMEVLVCEVVVLSENHRVCVCNFVLCNGLATFLESLLEEKSFEVQK